MQYWLRPLQIYLSGIQNIYETYVMCVSLSSKKSFKKHVAAYTFIHLFFYNLTSCYYISTSIAMLVWLWEAESKCVHRNKPFPSWEITWLTIPLFDTHLKQLLRGFREVKNANKQAHIYSNDILHICFLNTEFRHFWCRKCNNKWENPTR